jgi:uncharacterized protein (DUF3820 family)
MGIADNIAARRGREELARETAKAVEFLVQAAEQMAAEVDSQVFWQSLTQALTGRLGTTATSGAPQPPAPPLGLAAMTDEDSRRFEHERFKYGQYKGQMIKDAPLSYLCWLADEAQFGIKLRRYLQAPRVRDELRKEGLL